MGIKSGDLQKKELNWLGVMVSACLGTVRVSVGTSIECRTIVNIITSCDRVATLQLQDSLTAPI